MADFPIDDTGGMPLAPPAALNQLPSVDDILNAPAELPTVDDILNADPARDELERAKPTVDSILDGAPPASAGVGTVAARALLAPVAALSAQRAANKAVGTLFDGEYGLSEQNLARFTNQTPGQVNDPIGTIRTFNRVVMEGGSAAADVAMRAIFAPIVGSVAAVGDVARTAGMPAAWAERLERDLLLLAETAGIVTGAVPAMSMPKFRMAARERILAASDDIPAAERLTATRDMAAALDEGAAVAVREAGDATNLPPIRELGPVPDAPLDAMPLTEPRIAQPLSKNVVDAASELLIAGKVQRVEGRLISDQIMELLQTKRLTTEEIGAVLAKNNITPDDFAELWRVNIRKAAQDMQTLSALEQRMKALNKVPDAEGGLAAMQEAAGIGVNERTLNWWQRVDNIRRGMLVTQLSTAARNLETQVGRVGLDVLQQGLDDGLRRTFLAPGVREANPIDAFGSLVNIFRPLKTKQEVDSILNAFPKEQDRLLGNWMSEFQGGMFGKAETAVKALNVVNRTQEYVVRRAVFQSRLSAEMDALGTPLEDIVARNAIGEIPRAAIEKAVDSALEMTFSKNFSPFADGAEGLAGSMIRVVNQLPGATLVVPFPRFLANAIKFQYEWSPLGYLRLLSPTERAAVAAGDTSAISRATIGTGLLLSAYQFRDSEYAGEKWYELKLPDGKIVDLRPFNPFASYLFVADVAKRKRDGTLNSLTANDVAMGILATQLRAGTGAYLLDTAFEGIAGLETSEKGWRAIQDLAGNTLSGFTVPFNMVGDFLSEFDQATAVVRSGSEGPTAGPVNFGPVLRNIPGVKNDLPAVQSPLKEGPTERQAGALRQLTGIAISGPKNPVEQEIDRLGITRREYFPSSGDPMTDRLVATDMGPIVEKALPALVESQQYKDLPAAVQAYVLIEALRTIRNIAKGAVANREPALAARLKLESMSDRKRAAVNALSEGGIDKAIEALRATEQR